MPMPMTYPTVTLPMILSATRTLVAMLGGFAIAKGWMTSDQVVQDGGSLAVLITGGFGIYQKIEAERRLKAAIAAPAGLARPPSAAVQ